MGDYVLGAARRRTALPKLFDPKDLGKPNIRMPDDDTYNPYAEGASKPPIKDWQVAGRGWEWWFGIIGSGIVFGLFAWWKSKSG